MKKTAIDFLQLVTKEIDLLETMVVNLTHAVKESIKKQRKDNELMYKLAFTRATLETNRQVEEALKKRIRH